jgi:hypothetical protein
MKKFLSMLLVLTMVLAIASGAMAACKFKKGDWVEFKCDSNAYNAAKSSKKTNNVVAKGSYAECDKVCGKYARLIVNVNADTKAWFKVDDLKETSKFVTKVVWAKGGKGMSTERAIYPTDPVIKGLYVKVSGHTNLRKAPGMKCASQGVVEKGKLLKLTGRYGFDDRDVEWFEVCYKGKKLWVSTNFLKVRSNGYTIRFYDKDGNRVYPSYE